MLAKAWKLIRRKLGAQAPKHRDITVTRHALPTQWATLQATVTGWDKGIK